MHCIANQPERGNRSSSADCAQCTLHCALCRDWECVSAKCGQCIVSNSGFVLAPFAGFCRGHLTRSQSALRNTMLQAEENKPKRGTERRNADNRVDASFFSSGPLESLDFCWQYCEIIPLLQVYKILLITRSYCSD